MAIGRELRKLFRIPERFGREKFAEREKWRSDYLVLAGALLGELRFASVLDVGCANGFLLSEFLSAGKEVAGIEASAEIVHFLPPELREKVRVGDFAEVRGRWDLVCCVEVAEHIPAKRSAELVATLASAARQAVYFTAAPPGQHGLGHINCRPRSDWLAMFARHGWRENSRATEAIARRLAAIQSAHWLKRNGMLLEPAGALA